jgi:hypothetical protein
MSPGTNTREGADVLVSYLEEHEDAGETKRHVEGAGRKAVTADGAIAAGDAIEMSAIDDVLATTLDEPVDRNLTGPMPDADLSGSDRYGHALANEAPWHRVAVGVDLDRAVVADHAHQLPQAAERRPVPERFQPMPLVALEASHRRLAGRAVRAHVRDVALPFGEVRLERFPACEGVSRDRVLLHIADAALGLTLRAGPVWRTSSRRKTPVLGECDQLVVELDRAARRVVAHDQRARVVHQHLFRHAAESRERALEPRKPALLLLMAERPHMAPARMPESRHEHERLDLGAADLDQTLTKVDLQLPARRRLEPRRSQRLSLQRLPIRLNRALHRPQADRQSLLGEQILPHDVGIAAMAQEALAQPVIVPVEHLRPRWRLERHHAARRHVMLHRVVAAAQLPRDPLDAPAAGLQAHHRRHIVRRLHHLPPWIVPRRASCDSFLVHPCSPQLSEEGAIPRVAEGAVFHVA